MYGIVRGAQCASSVFSVASGLLSDRCNCMSQCRPKVACRALYRELRFRGFPYGTELLQQFCGWASELGFCCLGDFLKHMKLLTLMGANLQRVFNDLIYLYDLCLNLKNIASRKKV